MKLTDEQLTELAKKSERATPGPWVSGKNQNEVDFVRQKYWVPCGYSDHNDCAIAQTIHDVAIVGLGHTRAKADAEYIASVSPETCLALIRELQAAREALSEYQRFNRIRNDLDAYLHAMGTWALDGGEGDNPVMKSYGIDL